MKATIREMTGDDLDAVLEIEGECFTDAWSRPMFEFELTRHQSRYVVAEADGVIAGYGGILVIPPEAEILNIAVSAGFRRGGIGRMIVSSLVAHAVDSGARTVYLEVRKTGLAAQALYIKMGFVPMGIRPGYYVKPPEDAVVMRMCVDEMEDG